ncbi:hypothetical protein MRB53_040731 [Persea americana]|nr:hypothetical protein MRB53_040731 [Persea americana]
MLSIVRCLVDVNPHALHVVSRPNPILLHASSSSSISSASSASSSAVNAPAAPALPSPSALSSPASSGAHVPETRASPPDQAATAARSPRLASQTRTCSSRHAVTTSPRAASATYTSRTKSGCASTVSAAHPRPRTRCWAVVSAEAVHRSPSASQRRAVDARGVGADWVDEGVWQLVGRRGADVPAPDLAVAARAEEDLRGAVVVRGGAAAQGINGQGLQGFGVAFELVQDLPEVVAGGEVPDDDGGVRAAGEEEGAPLDGGSSAGI